MSANALRLREVEYTDKEALIAANKANRAFHMPWSAPFCDEAGFRQWFSSCIGDDAKGFIALEVHTGAIVGVLTLSQIVRGNFCSAYLGYYGMQETAGRGLMTTAVRRVVSAAFGPLGLHRVEANIQPGNKRSIALVKRVGFEKEGFSPAYLRINGQWRDHERWAIRPELLL
ncbi:GNAT family N-acetyltransferase [Neokomagataea tanensis]|uniref:GNAT family N-acetyltransferase n=2 Tax=Neokomagataea TaxID=1223423 RepID=A0A4Y6V6S1_9PROT|nr:GNAT family N-acetyltransferase [Neokomagataea tanensis]